MARVNIQLKGADKLIKDLTKLGKEATFLVGAETADAANAIELNAKSKAPVDKGRLRQSITSQKIADLTYRVFTNVDYAPYMEFGTGRLTSVPPALKRLAAQFKGKGIREVNLMPQPFMYPAFIIERPKYIKALKRLLKRLIK